MTNLNSITNNWNELLQNLKEQHSFGDGDFDHELFKSTVKDTFDYFYDIEKSQKNRNGCKLSINECELIANIYAYTKTLICTASDIEDYCYASQYVALILYKEITCYWGAKDINSSEERVLCNRYDFKDDGKITIEFNVDNIDMSDILSKIEYVKSIVW